MKLIQAIIQPPKLDLVREALVKVGVERMTVIDAHGYGRQRGQKIFYRGREYQINTLQKVMLEIAVNDDFVDKAVGAILSVARAGDDGTIGDGKIFIMPMDQAHDMGSHTCGPQAI